MAVRIISSIIGLPILIALVLFGGIYLKIGILFVSLTGMYEFYKAVSGKIMPIHFIGFLMAVIYIFSLNTKLINVDYRLFLMPTILLLFALMVFQYGKVNIFDCAVTFTGFFYIAFMLSNIFLIKELENGQYYVWLVFICAFCSDIGAYFTGVTFGKHKLTPVLSPNKTWEGAIGGVVFTALMTALFVFVISKIYNFEINNLSVLIFFFIGSIGSIFAQIGDLTASSIKRHVNIKDFGHIIPGHGGALDRFDSVLFTAPTIYALSKLLL